jgi:phosphate transport system substrate-binding protein
MRTSFRPARIAAALLVLCLAIGAPAASAFAAHKNKAPHVKITPEKGLLEFFAGDGVFTTISWSGFPSRQPIYMRECVRGATDPTSQCSKGGAYGPCGPLTPSCPGVPFLGSSDKTGRGTGVGEVAIGLINSTQSLDPIPGLSFICDYQDPCSLWVGTNPTDLSTGVMTPIGFATPADACPDSGTPLNGSTGSAPFRILLGWATKVCEPPDNIGMQTTLQTASAGIDGYISGQDDFAATSLPMDGAERNALKASGRTAAFAPIAASGLVFGYRLFDQRTGNQITNLVLTPEMLAQIFTGKVTRWYDLKGIQQLNPGVGFPQLIGAIARGDANEDSLVMTRWMWANARSTWVSGGVGSGIHPNPFGVGPTDLLPSLGQTYLVTGANKEASVIRNGDNNDFTSTSEYGLIGYLESSYAAQFSLPTVKIRLPNGQTVAATADTIRAGLAHMQPDCVTGLLEPDVGIQSSKIWPMPTVSYLMVPHGDATAKTKPTPEVAAAIDTLLHFATTDGAKALPAGYVALPDDLRTQAQDVAKTVEHAPKPKKDAAPVCPPPPPNDGGGTPTPPPSTSTGGGTGTGGTTPPVSTGGTSTPSQTVSPSPAPTTAPTTVIVAAKPPPMALTASKAGLILPSLVILGLIAAIVGFFLLYGDRLFARLAPISAGVKKASPTRLMKGRSKGAGSG